MSSSSAAPLDDPLGGQRHGSRSSSNAESASRGKSSLVIAAESIDRASATATGYLRKHNSQARWQKRYFELVGHYWVR